MPNWSLDFTSSDCCSSAAVRFFYYPSEQDGSQVLTQAEARILRPSFDLYTMKCFRQTNRRDREARRFEGSCTNLHSRWLSTHLSFSGVPIRGQSVQYWMTNEKSCSSLSLGRRFPHDSISLGTINFSGMHDKSTQLALWSDCHNLLSSVDRLNQIWNALSAEVSTFII